MFEQTTDFYSTGKWKATRKQVLARDKQGTGWVCYWCNKDIEGTPQADHITPRELCPDPYDLTNLVVSCKSCNSSKQDKVVWRQNFHNESWFVL